MHNELRVLGYGELLGKSLNLYLDNFLALFTISLISTLPSYLYDTFVLQSAEFINANFFVYSWGSLFYFVLSLAMTTLATGLMIEIIARSYTGMERAGFAEYVNYIIPKVLPMLGLAFLVGLLTMVGTLLFIVPGIVAGLGLAIATPVLIWENKGITESMRRSWDLTSGKKGKIFLYLIGVGIIYLVLFSILIFVISSITGSMGGILSNDGYHEQHILSAVITPFMQTFIVLLYFNLRIEKEGYGIENLIARYASEEK